VAQLVRAEEKRKVFGKATASGSLRSELQIEKFLPPTVNAAGYFESEVSESCRSIKKNLMNKPGKSKTYQQPTWRSRN
jgi:hypothetical protein